MSDETMPYDVLEQELASERKRREAAERERDEERVLWQEASGLECGGDPDGVTPRGLAKYLREVEARAEQAERERDEARSALADAVKVVAETHVARDRAEADNAALLQGIAAFHEAWKTGRDTLALAALLRLAQADHPGAAILEESERRRQLLEDVAKACRGLAPVTPEVEAVVGRSLERMRAADMVRELLKEGVMGGHIILVDECRELSEACASYDALKPETK